MTGSSLGKRTPLHPPQLTRHRQRGQHEELPLAPHTSLDLVKLEKHSQIACDRQCGTPPERMSAWQDINSFIGSRLVGLEQGEAVFPYEVSIGVGRETRASCSLGCRC
ncbi:hypothetical protein BDV96DRAFT_601712 [Lophiotrema nucula]|uniref:Uncharacterized protein n=1 Tax=Lophiotrema nucula TaxID=690887 RepID=A0A6A5Z1J5_9PLEO|nr:hypothetical protein BDV96DRAFT_601712 [Lophiotrema nucula]